MTGQLTFDLPGLETWARGDFLTSAANATALQAIEGWRDWPGGRLLLLGPAGSGKTHLAHIWADQADAHWLRPGDLQDRLPTIAPQDHVVLDDAHTIRGVDEAALFHLYNRLAPLGRLMVTATSAPRDWGVHLADLLSRLQAMPVVRLEAPDDTLLAGVLGKLLADRQIAAPPNLIPYLLPRIERSMAAARALVAALDARSLATQRPVTRALAAEVLDTVAPE